jgi:aerobic carbon-monoxide dehydrogenase medium subunit
MRTFDFFSVKHSQDAVTLLAKHSMSAKVRIIAGGTDLLPELKFSSQSPNVVVDISRAEDLKSITLSEDGLRIGAVVTHSELMA